MAYAFIGGFEIGCNVSIWQAPPRGEGSPEKERRTFAKNLCAYWRLEMMTANLAAIGWPMGVLALTSSERWAAARELNCGFTGLTWSIVIGVTSLIIVVVSALLVVCRQRSRRLRAHG